MRQFHATGVEFTPYGPATRPSEGNPLGNPIIWPTSARALIQLAYENPAYFSTYQGDVGRVLAVGTQLEHALNNITCTNLPGGGINYPLWRGLFAAYTNAIPPLQVALSNLEGQYAGSLGLPYIDFFNELDYLEPVAGSPHPPYGFGEAPIRAGAGSNAVINAPGFLFPNADGGVTMMDSYYTNSFTAYYIRTVSFAGDVHTVAGFNAVYNYATIGPQNACAVANYGASQIYLLAYSPFLHFAPFVGSATPGYRDGTNALLGGISGLKFNAASQLFVYDQANNAIRVVTTDGSVSTLATNLPVMPSVGMIFVGADTQGGAYLQFGVTNYSQELFRVTSTGYQLLAQIPPVIFDFGSGFYVTNFINIDTFCQPSGAVWMAINQYAQTNGFASSDIAIGESINQVNTNNQPQGALVPQYYLPYDAPLSYYSGTYAGPIGGGATPPGFSDICVDNADNIWVPLAGGLLRIGGSPVHTIGFLNTMSNALQQAGALYSAASSLSGYKPC